MSSELRQAIEAGLTECWAALFALSGRLRATPTRLWRPVGQRRILVVAPHPDDEVCGCAGTMFLHGQAGDELTVVHVTDGSRSRALGLGPTEMRARRRQEAQSAAALLGLRQLEWLGLPEGEWQDTVLQDRLAGCLERWQPQVIYAPSRIDFHPEHLRVAAALGRVLKATKLDPQPTIRVYQVQVPLTPVLTNLISPITAVEDGAAAALRAYQSQLGSVLRVQRLKRYAAAFYRVPGLVEEFWELTAPAYELLHRDLKVDGGKARFRGIRAVPLADPLCYWVGLNERRTLRKLVEEQA